MSNINVRLLTEQVYVTSQVNRIYEGILKEQSVNPRDSGIVKKVMKEMGLASSFIFQFGTGIGAFVRPVTELLKNNGVSLTKEEVALLLITSFAVMVTHSKVEIGKLREAVRDKDLEQYLTDVTKFILNTKKILVAIGEKIGRTVHTLADVLGFTFMLVPTMNVLKEVIIGKGVDSESVYQFLMGLTLAAGTYSIKVILEKILDKFKN